MMVIEMVVMNRSCDEPPKLVVRTTLILLAFLRKGILTFACRPRFLHAPRLHTVSELVSPIIAMI